MFVLSWQASIFHPNTISYIRRKVGLPLFLSASIPMSASTDRKVETSAISGILRHLFGVLCCHHVQVHLLKRHPNSVPHLRAGELSIIQEICLVGQ